VSSLLIDTINNDWKIAGAAKTLLATSH